MQRRAGIYTIGYEDLRIDQLVTKLRENEIETVVDVRLNASSRRPGFSKRGLTTALSAAGIGYLHERDLGNPPENRDAFRNGPVEEGRQHMKQRLENGSSEALGRLVDRAPRAGRCLVRRSRRSSMSPPGDRGSRQRDRARTLHDHDLVI